jgi:hypothetical protein
VAEAWLILDATGYPASGGQFSSLELARLQARNWAEANGKAFRVVPWKETSVSKWPPKYGPDEGERIEPSWGDTMAAKQEPNR